MALVALHLCTGGPAAPLLSALRLQTGHFGMSLCHREIHIQSRGHDDVATKAAKEVQLFISAMLVGRSVRTGPPGCCLR